jgi:hypothetical protein
MEASVRFYKVLLRLETLYGGEGSNFTLLRTKEGGTILNLEHGSAGIQWERLIFHVSDVDRFRPPGRRGKGKKNNKQKRRKLPRQLVGRPVLFRTIFLNSAS